jgi:DNA-binding transcriptional MocR family regulator
MNPNDMTEINLRLGWPNPRVLPIKLLQEASQLALSKPEAYTRDSLLEYGPDDGFKPLRDKIAVWLTTFYLPSQPITTERICISGGASQNLACVLDTFTDPVVTQYIWMIAPTYFCACRVFDDAGFAGRLRAVPEDSEGMDIRFLCEQLKIAEDTRPVSTVAMKTRRPWNKTYRHVIYLVPTFANPSGRIMSARRREELVRVARKHDALIVSDDVYDMLGWHYTASENEGVRKTCQPRLVDVDRYLDGSPSDDFGNAISNGSFSKIIGPGLRTVAD